MAQARKKGNEKKDKPLEILEMRTGEFDAWLLGKSGSGLVCNAFPEKAAREMLMPASKEEKKSQQAKRLKHDPPAEFRNSVYRSRGDDHPTRIQMPAVAIKKGMKTAAIEMPGDVNGAMIGRLVWIVGDRIPIWGVPKLWMDMVRQAGPGKTPDIRTRAILPAWATRVTIRHVMPNLRLQPLANLLGAAGIIAGIGDGRQEKGTLSYGQFEVVDQNDPRLKRVLAGGGLAAQDAALANPACYNLETQELLEWWKAEVRRRGFTVVKGA